MSLIVILGMHRSGTSLLCQSLHAAGLYLGNDLLSAGIGNLDGHLENLRAIKINENILSLSGGSWHTVPPGKCRSDEQIEAAITSFLGELRRHAPAGWKDPRTILTWPRWLPFLQGADYVVAAYRHPLAVAHSLTVREGWPLERSLALWADYNERLLQITERHPAVAWFNFDTSPAAMAEHLESICRVLSLPYPEKVRSLFNPFLRHHAVSSETIPDRRAAALYERLCGQAGPAPVETFATASLPQQFEQLSRVVVLLDRAVQRQRCEIVEVADSLRQVAGTIDALRTVLREELQPLLEAHRELERHVRSCAWREPSIMAWCRRLGQRLRRLATWPNRAHASESETKRAA